MTTDQQRPAPGSHDRSQPSGSLELSAANLFEAMRAAREAEEKDGGNGALHAFYRTLMNGMLLLPVPPDHGEEAKAALATAVNDSDEVEISVMLARDGNGDAVSVCFASNGAMAAWAPRGTASLPLPARVAVANLAAAGMPAGKDPTRPITYPFEITELAALADGRLPGTDEPIFADGARSSVRLRIAGPAALPLERSLAAALDGSRVSEAYLLESETDGRARLLLGLVGEAGAAVTVDVPDGSDVVWLEEPLLTSVRAVTEPFFRGPGRAGHPPR
jgi:hypothetical protein